MTTSLSEYSLLYNLFSCNFEGITKLWGWSNKHSHVHHTKPSTASETCSKADFVAIKTIVYGHNLTTEVLPLLDELPNLKVIDLVRDPRGVFNSQSTTVGTFDEADISGLFSICEHYGNNVNVTHPRIKRVVFEDWATNAMNVSKDIYEFIGREFGSTQEKWITGHFEKSCSIFARINPFSDCRSNQEKVITAWASKLSQKQLDAFESNEDCLKVAKTYNFPLGVTSTSASAERHALLFLFFMTLLSFS